MAAWAWVCMRNSEKQDEFMKNVRKSQVMGDWRRLLQEITRKGRERVIDYNRCGI